MFKLEDMDFLKRLRKLNLLAIALIALCLNLSAQEHKDFRISLKGEWQFQTDPDDQGVAQKWFAKNLAEVVHLPGSMKENGKGNVPTLKTDWTGSIYDSSFYYNPRFEKYRQAGDIKFPFWLTPNLYYKGAAWYRKEVTIPADWTNRRLVLFLERPHWQTTVWFDDQLVGSQNSLSTPHQFDLTNL
ncbi:MAG TPA: hypothetical protein VKA27_04125, partial [Sunxiuqinia sp.]|nr:hypothetical protein [Sunxiuqinia sp.]